MTDSIAIDWQWVAKELFEKERLFSRNQDTSKDALRACANVCLEEAKGLVKPAIVSAHKNILKISPGSIDIEGPIRFSGKYLSSYIAGAEATHLFLVTIGSELERIASQYMTNADPLRGYLLDSIGSLAVESMAEEEENSLRQFYGLKNKNVSMRFSPGYCDWPVEEQRIFAKAIDFSIAGVKLTENCMMDPKKSISALTAIGGKNLFIERKYPCLICNKGDCSWRRKR